MGGIHTTYPLKANAPGQVVVAGSFRPQGSGAPLYPKGSGFSVERSSEGIYLVTFDEDVTFPTKVSVLTGLRHVTDDGVHIQAGVYDATNRTLQFKTMTGLGTYGHIHLPLGAFQEQDGTALADFSAGPTPGWSAGDESGGIRWGTHANPDPVSTQFMWPADVDTANNATLHILAAKTGATAGDAVTWLVEAFNNVSGAVYDADADYGGTSSAMTGDATAGTVQDETLTLAAANLPAAFPCFSTLTIQPTDGKLGTDDVIMVGAYIEYTKANVVDMAADGDNEISFMVVADNDQVDNAGDS